MLKPKYKGLVCKFVLFLFIIFKFGKTKFMIVFPIHKGLCLKRNKKRVLTTLNKQGKISVCIFDDSLSISHKIPFLRGLIFLFVGVFYYLKSFYQSIDFENDAKTIDEIIGNNLKISNKMVVVSFLVFFSILIGFVGLTILPYQIYRGLFGYGINRYTLAFIIGVYRVLQVYLIIYLSRFIPSIAQIYRYNSAGNIAVNLTTFGSESIHRTTNFYNYLLNSFLVTLFMVSFVVFPINYFLRVLICLGIMLFSFSVVYEYLNFIKGNKFFNKINLFTSVLVCLDTSKTEKHIAQTTILEGDFLSEEIQTNEDLNKNKILLSTTLSEVKDGLFSVGLKDISEVEWLVAEVLGKKRNDLRLIRYISKEEYKKIKSALSKRMKRIPLSKIIGQVDFFGRKFYVDKNVLSPRMETELVVEEAINIVQSENLKSVLDLCSGSGIIAITLSKEVKVKTFASDISELALSVAKKNSKFNNAKVKFFCSDLFSKINKKFDLIISNPPYIKSKEIEELDDEVKFHDPLISLDGGEDGLFFYREIIKEAPMHLNKNGFIIFEIGYTQANSIKKLLQNDFENIKIKKDYSKNDRIVIAQLKGIKNVRKN